MVAPTMMSRIQTTILSRAPARRHLRDQPSAAPARAASTEKKSEISPVRLVGYFVGGILLANLVLMTSAMFRGDAASAPNASADVAARRGPAAAVERSLQVVAADPAATPSPAPEAAPAAAAAETLLARPAVVVTCAEARDKLIAGMTHYYLQRSRRPRAAAGDVVEAAGVGVLFAGPADPAVQGQAACAG